MDWQNVGSTFLGMLLTVGSIGTVFLTLDKVFVKFNINPFRKINECLNQISVVTEKNGKRLDGIEGQLEDHNMKILRLTITSTEMPIAERLKASDEYLKKRGNSGVEVVCEKLKKEYGERLERDKKIL